MESGWLVINVVKMPKCRMRVTMSSQYVSRKYRWASSAKRKTALSFQFESISQFAQDVFDDDLAVNVAGVFQVYDDGAALVSRFQDALIQQRCLTLVSVKKPQLTSE